MSPLRDGLAGSVGAAVPRGGYLRLRFRASLDMVLTLAIAILAIALIVAYQVLSRTNPKRFEGPR